MAGMGSVRLKGAALVILLVLFTGTCKREGRDGAGALTASLMFDDASPDVREALASRVDFRINDDNFARWEEAQRNLERLPRTAIPSTPARGRTAVDRAVSRLESSPYTRTAIERTGLSVRDFVLATIALAQATEAAQTGRSVSSAPVPPENFQFVRRYSARVLRARAEARVASAEAESYDMQYEHADVMSGEMEADIQMRLDEAEREVETRLAELEAQREKAEHEAEHEAEMLREEAEHEAEMRREAAEHNAEMRRLKPRRDSLR